MNARTAVRWVAIALAIALAWAALLAHLQPSAIAALMQLAAFCQ